MTKQIVDTFWENFNMSRCKTAMLVIAILITFGLVYCECFGTSSTVLIMAFFAVQGFWAGRATKAKDPNVSFEDYKKIIDQNE